MNRIKRYAMAFPIPALMGLLLFIGPAQASYIQKATSGGGGGSVNDVTATAPLNSSGGTTPDISCDIASGSQDGCLAAADFATFLDKQDALPATTFGDLIYFDGTDYQRLGLGNIGDVLTADDFDGPKWTAIPTQSSFASIVPDAGSTVTASGASQPVTFTSSDSSVTITGSSGQVDFTVPGGGSGIGGSTGATDNRVLVADGTGGSTLKAAPVTITPTTGAISVNGSPGASALSIAGGSLTATNTAFFDLSETFNTNGNNYGINNVITTAGSGASALYAGNRTRMNAGYNGGAWMVGNLTQLFTASTGMDPTGGSGNMSNYAFTQGSTTGTNTGYAANTGNGGRNIGFLSSIDSFPSTTTGWNIGLYANTSPGNNANQKIVGVYSSLNAGTSASTSPLQSASGYFSNAATTHDILVGYNNTSKSFGFDDNNDLTLHLGNLIVATAGKGISIEDGTNATIGTATLVGGTATVSTTAIATGDKIFCTHEDHDGTPGMIECPKASITDGTSFVINSTSATDTSTVNWWIVKAP